MVVRYDVKALALRSLQHEGLLSHSRLGTIMAKYHPPRCPICIFSKKEDTSRPGKPGELLILCRRTHEWEGSEDRKREIDDFCGNGIWPTEALGWEGPTGNPGQPGQLMDFPNAVCFREQVEAQSDLHLPDKKLVLPPGNA